LMVIKPSSAARKERRRKEMELRKTSKVLVGMKTLSR